MKFTIRDLFLVTVIAALAVGWWVNRQQWIGAEMRRSDTAALWFRYCGAFERILIKEGYKVELGEAATIRVTSRDGRILVESAE